MKRPLIALASALAVLAAALILAPFAAHAQAAQAATLPIVWLHPLTLVTKGIAYRAILYTST